MIDAFNDSFSVSQLDGVSLTDCPVHALSMGSDQWVEMAWAARDAALAAMNQERRGWFEGIKCLLWERDLPPSRIFIAYEGTKI